jgi:2-polyprenyl-3-methyl-5-hydroxy-6-metoxy-1,4-benzoquinol methylase
VRVGAIPEGLVERVVMRLGVVPRPLVETQMSFTLARVIMAAADLGVFALLDEGPATSEDIAERLGTDPHATYKLLFALASSDYVRFRDGRYELTKVSRKWLLPDSPTDLTDKLRFQLIEWDLVAKSEEYVRTGKPLDIHDMSDPAMWDSYQRGMRAMAATFGAEGMRRLPIPSGAQDLLDIGGSHGYYSCELCRRNEGLRAVILDLPEAVDKAAPLLAAENMGDRVTHRPGNALTDDLGEEAWDVVMIAQVVHHFSEEQNRELAVRVARALRPGGVYAILDAFRPRKPGESGQLPSLLEFYFALTSQSGTWTPEEMADWQRAAGLNPKRPIRLRTAPGGGIQVAVKP